MVYRKYRRPLGRSRYILSKRSKYSVEQKSFTASYDSTAINGLFQSRVELVPAVAIQGMRKIKHVTLNMTQLNELSAEGDYAVNPIYWAIVYVPQGTVIGALNLNNSLYEPNQYVMNCGIVDPSAGPIRFSSPVSRNLNSGDAIYLVLGNYGTSAANTLVQGVVKYAITLN